MRKLLLSAGVFAVFFIFNAQVATLHAQGTAFTYQGRLNDGGAAANGSYDVAFTLFGTIAGGGAIAETVTNKATRVTNGLFTATIDFGEGVFTGNNYWLELAVQTNGGNGFTTLAPRQQITPEPYAMFANAANTASTVTGKVVASQLSSGVVTEPVAFANSQNTFAGDGSGLTGLKPANFASGIVTVPVAFANFQNTFAGDGSGLTGLKPANFASGTTTAQIAFINNSNSFSGGFSGIFNGTFLGDGRGLTSLPASVALLNTNETFLGVNTFAASVGIGTNNPATALHVVSPGDSEISIQSSDAGSHRWTLQSSGDENNNAFQGTFQIIDRTLEVERLVIATNGNVGIGTETPAAALQVVGNVQLGSGGANFATSSTENLRIVRGTVNEDGTIASGKGFSVVHSATGTYVITFTPAFSDPPAVTATSFGVFTTLQTASIGGITVFESGNGALVDAPFNFIAIGAP